MLSEQEVLDRHIQALGEAHRACQELGRNANDEYVNFRGPYYTQLKEALELLEGSARQMTFFREDARWVRLGGLYAAAMNKVQTWFIVQKWDNFNKLMPLFENGKRQLAELDRRTGRRGPILPQNPASWIVHPEWVSPFAPMAKSRMH